MYEMFWQKPPTAVDMFSMKKHMREEPANQKILGFNFTKEKALSSMRKTEYEDFKQSNWTQARIGLKPRSSVLIESNNAIGDMR